VRPLTFRSIALFILQALIFVLVQAGYGVAGSVTITGVIKPLAVENSQAIKYGGGEGTDTSGAEAGASNINLKGATVVALGDVSLVAGNNINVLDQHTESLEFEADYKKTSGFLSKKTSTSQSITDTVATVGSQVSGKNVLLQAGQVGEDGKLVSGSGDIKIQGSDISASDKVTLNAGRDILIVPGQGTLQESHEETHKRSGLSASFMSGVSVGTSSSKGTGSSSQTINVGSRIQGGDIQMQAGRDTTIQASQVIADRDIDVKAGRNINITAARDIQNSEYASSSRNSGIGLLPGLSANFTLLSHTTTDQNGKDRLGVGTTSVLSANEGNLTLRAGTDEQYKGTGQGNVTTQGADLLAKERVSISGNAVDLQAVETTHESEDHLRSKSLVVGTRPAGMLGAVINTADAALQSARSGSERLAGANALKAGYDAYKYAQNGAANEAAAVRQVTGSGGDGKAIDPNAASFGVSVSLSYSESRQDSSQNSTTQRGTNVQASNIDITANEGDITTHGAKLQAENIALDAAKNIHLLAVQNTQAVQSSSSSSGGGLGVTVALGEQSGVSFQANYGQSRNRGNGTETVHDNTQIIAGNRLSIKSGGDTELRGAQVAGKQVSVDVGGNLTIETLQDKTTYEMQQSSSGFNVSLCIPPICYGNPVTGSVNVSRTELNHNYQSAVGQSGISAGEGGYDIKVGGNTHLIGGAITSTAEPDKNQLQTQSLTFSDLTNTQDTHVSASSIGLSYGGGSALATAAANATSNLLGGTAALAGLPEAGSDRSQTQSVISPGKVTITGQDADGSSAQAVATLTQRDPETADQGLTNRLTLVQAQQIEANQREAQENLLIANQVGSVLTGAVGDISAGKWEDGAPEKVALHAMVGAAVVALGGGNAGVGLLTGAANELAVGVMRDNLTSQGYVQGTPEFNEMMKLGSAVLGTVISRTAGGDAQTTAASGQLARDATEHNFLSHKQEKEFKQDLASCQGDRSCIEGKTEKWSAIDEQQTADVDNCATGRACSNLAEQARTGNGYSSAEINAMCGGVPSCESFARSLARTNSNDTFNANGRATSVPVETSAQRLLDEGYDPLLVQTLGMISPADLAGKGPSNRGASKGNGGKGTGNGKETAPPVSNNGSANSVADETAALGRIRDNPNGPVLNDKAPNANLNKPSVPDKPVYGNKYPEHSIDPAKVVPIERLSGISGNFNYVVNERGVLIVGRSGHTSLTGGGRCKLLEKSNYITVALNGLITRLDITSRLQV